MIDGKLRHGVEARFEFIEFRAYWHGRLNRSDLIDHFGVSQTQTSQDLKAYQVDLSRFCSGQVLMLSGLAFEGHGAFPAQG